MISGRGRSTLVPAKWIRTSTPCRRRSTTSGSRRSPYVTSSASDKGVRGFSPPPERSLTPRSRSLGRKTPPTWPPAPDRATLVIVHPPQNANRGLTGPTLAPNPPHLDV